MIKLLTKKVIFKLHRKNEVVIEFEDHYFMQFLNLKQVIKKIVFVFFIFSIEKFNISKFCDS